MAINSMIFEFFFRMCCRFQQLKLIYVAIIIPGLFNITACSPKEPGDQNNVTIDAPANPYGLRFTDVTAETGLGDFRHETGAVGNKWFPEQAGAGCGFIDYDNDGWSDILLVSGGHWQPKGKSHIPALRLYRNNHDGTFVEVTETVGLGRFAGYSYGISVADYDNDGDEDIFLTTIDKNLLFQNRGGSFIEVSEQAGLANVSVWSSSAIFFDADRDGWLDLYVGSYVDWSPEIDIFCSFDGVNKSYCTPEIYKGIPSRFYHNNGDGTFTDKTKEAGFLPAPGKTLGMAEFDYNADGWPDLVVANDTQRNLLYRNNGDGTFAESGTMSGIAYDENGRARAGMGIDAGVVDQIGRLSIIVGNFSKEMIGVFRYEKGGFFSDRAAGSRIGRPSLMTLTFGLFMFDVDLDGDLDIFAANGHVQPDIEKTDDGITYKQPPHLFFNDGRGKFVDRATEIGGVLSENIVGRGAAYADYDKDGDLDILVTENGGPAHLWRNDLTNGNNYLRIKITGKKCNKNGFGTRIVAFNKGKQMERRIKTGSSYLSNIEPTVTFGLAQAAKLDSMHVYWASGRIDRFGEVQGNREIELVEGETIR